MSVGGRSTFYVEPLGSRHFGTGISVGISRETTLSEDLSRIDSRTLRGIRLEVGGAVVTVPREAALWLRDALNFALIATEDFAESPRIEATS